MASKVLGGGAKFSRDELTRGWETFLALGDYTLVQRKWLVDALSSAQVEEFESLLPLGCVWVPLTAEIVGPEELSLDAEELRELLKASGETVVERFPEIEEDILERVI